MWYVVDLKQNRFSAPSLGSRLTVLNGPALQGKRLTMKLEVRPRAAQPLDVQPDHGKMMHMAVFRLPDFTYFLHVHPRMTEPGVFEFEFTPPQPGPYKFFADLLHSSGISETVTNRLEVFQGES